LSKDQKVNLKSPNNPKNVDSFLNSVWIYLSVILLFSVLSFVFGNFYLGIVEIVLFLVLLVFGFSIKAKKKKQILDYMQNLTYHVDTVAKDSLLHFPMPITILKVDGKIIWHNKSFTELFSTKEQLGSTIISDLIPDINWFELIKSTSGISEDIIIGEKRFQMLGNVVKTQKKNEKDNYVVLLYWVEKTELYALKKQSEEQQTDIAIIMVDNYDEIGASIDDMVRTQIMSGIDKSIRDWANGTDGMLKKTDRDRYIFVFPHKNMKKFEEDKFSVLEQVRKISLSFDLKTPYTMSIGVGIGGSNVAENEAFAKTSLDMAMGRGGDQAVIKNKDIFKYFGGNYSEYEKNTRVKTKIISQAFRELVISCENVVVMGHKNGDMDSFGASIGIYRAAVSLNKTCFVIFDSNNKTIRESVKKFGQSKEYEGVFVSSNDAFELVGKNTLVVVVDVHRPSLVQEPKLLEKTKNIFLVDHHRRASEFIENASLVYHEPYASSTSEMVSEILQYIGGHVKLSKSEAECLYAGIVVDTKNFNFKTGVRTFEAASFLKKFGVDTIAIKRLFQTDFEDYKMRVNIVSHAEVIYKNIALSTCELSNISNNESSIIVAQAADELLDIGGISASFVVCAAVDSVIISARSLDDINVQVILETLGGGGHRTVAGVQLQDITIAEAKDKLTDAILKYLKENNK